MAKLEQVFGVSADQVLSYISRPQVDDRFLDAIKSNKQVVVYGASKQGKTALVSKYLPYDQHLPVSVTPKTEIVDIYSSVLRQLEVKFLSMQTESSARETHATAGVKVKAMIPLFGSGEAKAGVGAKALVGDVKQYEEVPFNLSLPCDLSFLVFGVKRIVLRNTMATFLIV